MNFKVRDTAWFINVGFTIFAFSIGLFSGFSISNQNVFVGNILLFIVSMSTILTGLALLFAATEVFVKTGSYPDKRWLRFLKKFYLTSIGQDPSEADGDYSKHQDSFVGEELNINPAPPQQGYLSKDEIISLSYKIQENLELRKRLPPKPDNKPIIHEINTEPQEIVVVNVPEIVSESSKMNEPQKNKKKKPFIYSIITVGVKGIDVRSESFRKVLEDALKEFNEDPSFRLRLKGETYGLGARGVKTVRKNTEFISYDVKDVQKIMQKIYNFSA